MGDVKENAQEGSMIRLQPDQAALVINKNGTVDHLYIVKQANDAVAHPSTVLATALTVMLHTSGLKPFEDYLDQVNAAREEAGKNAENAEESSQQEGDDSHETQGDNV